MKAIVIEKPGGPEVLKLEEVEAPRVGDGQVLIKVFAAGVNRNDLDRRARGLGRPGIECSGQIIEVGWGVTEWKCGQMVCAVLDGGGYAEEVAVSARLVLPIPKSVNVTEAASLPEAACATWKALSIGLFKPGKRLLIHENCGDIGILALQTAKARGSKVFVVGGSDEKFDFYRHLGAHMCINYKTEDFTVSVKEATSKQGVDLILDSWANNLKKDIAAISYGGVVVFVDLHGSQNGELSLWHLVAYHADIRTFDRWNMSEDERAEVVVRVRSDLWPEIEKGLVKPLVDRYFPLDEAADAHMVMEGRSKFSQKISSSLGPIGRLLESAIYTGKVADGIKGKIILKVVP